MLYVESSYLLRSSNAFSKIVVVLDAQPKPATIEMVRMTSKVQTSADVIVRSQSITCSY